MARRWDDTLPERGRQAFAASSDDDKARALVHATEFIDTLPFKGERATPTQSLSWPRKGVFRDDGTPVTGIPIEIKQATAMVASFILAKVPYDVPALAWVFTEIGHLLRDDLETVAQRRPDRTWH
jgi:hypothetical protein